MFRRLGPLAVALMLIAPLAAGCGDDESSDSAPATPAATATTEAPTATEEEPTTTGESGGTAAPDGQSEATVERCKQAVADSPSVPDDVKGDIEEICERAATADPEEAKELAREACEKIVTSSVPEGASREQALEACASAGG